MKFYYLFIPCFIIILFIAIDTFYKWWTWRKELKRDAEIKKHIDYLLGDEDIQKWYEREYPTTRLLENR